jgi:hypothetical protein
MERRLRAVALAPNARKRKQDGGKGAENNRPKKKRKKRIGFGEEDDDETDPADDDLSSFDDEESEDTKMEDLGHDAEEQAALDTENVAWKRRVERNSGLLKKL